MAALLTDRFRVVLAENFRNRVLLGESGGADPINLWLFFARSDTWVGGLPPDPTDNQDAAFDIYDQMLGKKKLMLLIYEELLEIILGSLEQFTIFIVMIMEQRYQIINISRD